MIFFEKRNEEIVLNFLAELDETLIIFSNKRREKINKIIDKKKAK